jgi:hypothetical protein
VLGIEAAQLDETFDTQQGLSCEELPDEHPVESCGTNNNCDFCLGQCPRNAIPSCVEDPDCRKALFRHRICVRDGCVDEDGHCGRCLEQAPGAECLAGCADECRGSELVSLCELFCTCMAANCPGSLPNCIADCQAGPTPDFELECVLSHCELADRATTKNHCLHATHEQRQCPEQAPEPVPGCPATQKLNGYACRDNDECCNGLCMPNSADDLTGTCM